DLVDLCRAIDGRIRLVADGSVRCGLARRPAGRASSTLDRAAPGPARLAAGAVHGGAGQRDIAAVALADRVALVFLPVVLHRADELGRAVRSRHLWRAVELVCTAPRLRDLGGNPRAAGRAGRDAADRAIGNIAAGLARRLAGDRRGDVDGWLCTGLAIAGTATGRPRVATGRAARGGWQHGRLARDVADGRARLLAAPGVAHAG